MRDNFKQTLAENQERTAQALRRLLSDPVASNNRSLSALQEACLYSVENGGKRVRPLMVYAAAHAVDADIDANTLEAPSVAIELIHSYSLVHDDLPAMDDDDLRRGRPSLHKAYDEATAILVGDGLQARAFELLANSAALEPAQKVAMISALASASGPAGMVGGQFIDIQAIDTIAQAEALQHMHSLKTGALIRAAASMGGIAAGADQVQLEALDSYADHIGLAFQVVDDILDVEADSQTLGKTSGKDREANKPTYVALLSLEGAKEEAQRLLQEALVALEGFGESATVLRQLAQYIVNRNH